MSDIQRQAAMNGVKALLHLMGEDPTREGLRDTPRRVVDAYLEMAGRPGDPAQLLSVTFNDHVPDQMIAVGPLPFVSLCEHHLLPFSGHAWLGYIPGASIVGLSKLGRLLDHYAHRPQVQERLTGDLADSMWKHLDPQGCGAIVQATHSCMALRGARKEATMVTSALRGAFMDDARARSEFLAMGGR